MLNNTELEVENAQLHRLLESSTTSEHRLRLEVENLTNQVAHHKRVRKAITRQLKDVEKARKYEAGVYLYNYGQLQALVSVLKNEIQQLKSESSFWKFWK